MKKTYLEILKKPVNLCDVVKRVDVTGYSKIEIAKQWEELEKQYNEKTHTSRQITVNREMRVFDNL